MHYDPETGVFTARVTRQGVRVGQTLGKLTGKGYISLQIFNKYYRRNRLAWLYVTGGWPNGQVDHRNRIKIDDRFSNLRDATHGQNRINSAVRKDSRSGFKGVCARKRKDGSVAYQASLSVPGGRLFLGTFGTAEEAHIAYRQKAIELHGEFANP